ncbi:cyclophilin-like fold protein [Curvibacter sp. HBC28]|uniref:Cyclophilin-like fold protein n=1 Tax=Curvibacter microcysteis TaxID=3026419 RepID=A0ABT5MBA4_9BURK|nr:cyclophilin-like fold protein [Curvibacter sp. HBC28]MDD0813274.1 cyclophilin-like fold protein [Curvibacter sp. HBC28]
MKIHLHVDAQVATATLDDTAAARDFAALLLLPLTLTLTDYGVIERIADLPRKLSVTGAPAAHAPQAGELTYYAPWGNLAIFLDSNVRAQGLVRLGRVDTGLATLKRPGPFRVRIERAPD